MILARCVTFTVPAALAISALASPLRGQSPAAPAPPSNRVSFDLGAGAMRYGPHGFAGVELAAPRWPVALRVDGLVGVAAAHDVPGRGFGAIGASVVLPLRLTGTRLTPYVVGGAAASFSPHLAPAVEPVAGAGLRLRLGGVTPFLDVRTAPRGGVPVSLGVRF